MATSITERRRAFSVAELSASYGLSVGFLRQHIRGGTLPAKKVGRRVIVLASDFEQFLNRASLGACDEVMGESFQER